MGFVTAYTIPPISFSPPLNASLLALKSSMRKQHATVPHDMTADLERAIHDAVAQACADADYDVALDPDTPRKRKAADSTPKQPKKKRIEQPTTIAPTSLLHSPPADDLFPPTLDLAALFDSGTDLLSAIQNLTFPASLPPDNHPPARKAAPRHKTATTHRPVSTATDPLILPALAQLTTAPLATAPTFATSSPANSTAATT